jgi:O-antigen/teichoic acid export membrane protein
MCDGEMFAATLTRVFRKSAGRTLTLRAGVVAVNFGVMIGLAALLGLDLFGRLIFLWGAALVASTVLSLGGPLILLRRLTDGGGMRARDIIRLILVYPAVLGVVAGLMLTALWPVVPWIAVFLIGFMVNALTCLASLMRALGSVQLSMTLRDAGPQLALGLGGLIAVGAKAEGILFVSVVVMLAIGAAATVLCLRSPHLQQLLCNKSHRVMDLSLWGTSVLGMAVAQMDLIIGGAVLSNDALGIYALLRRIANLVALPVSVATWVSAASVSKAHGAGSKRALQDASAAGSQIAFFPGAALFLVGFTCLPGVVVFAPESALPFGILLGGAFVQVFLASGFTVATLCSMAGNAALARLVALMGYLVIAQLLGASLSPVTNALAYTAAMSLGSVFLWAQIWRKLDVDTSAYALRAERAQAWRPS